MKNINRDIRLLYKYGFNHDAALKLAKSYNITLDAVCHLIKQRVAFLCRETKDQSNFFCFVADNPTEYDINKNNRTVVIFGKETKLFDY